MTATYAATLHFGEIRVPLTLAHPINLNQESGEGEDKRPGSYTAISVSDVVALLDLIDQGHASPERVRRALLSLNEKVEERFDTERAAPELPSVASERQPVRAEQYVYVIGSGSGGHLKIGISANPEQRLDQIRNASPMPLSIRWKALASHRIERALHDEFHEHRLHGEWFDFTGHPDPVAAIRWAALRLGAKEVDA